MCIVIKYKIYITGKIHINKKLTQGYTMMKILHPLLNHSLTRNPADDIFSTAM